MFSPFIYNGIHIYNSNDIYDTSTIARTLVLQTGNESLRVMGEGDG